MISAVNALSQASEDRFQADVKAAHRRGKLAKINSSNQLKNERRRSSYSLADLDAVAVDVEHEFEGGPCWTDRRSQPHQRILEVGVERIGTPGALRMPPPFSSSSSSSAQ
jgi:hypothetical protein